MSQQQMLPQTGFVRLPIVLNITGMGKSKIWQMAKEGTFPKPYRLAARCVGWKVEELRAWIESKSQHQEGHNHAA